MPVGKNNPPPRPKGVVNYATMQLVEDDVARVIGLESIEELPNLEAATIYEGKRFYIGAITEQNFAKILGKEIGIGVPFKEMRNAFVPANSETMAAIQKELKSRHPKGVPTVSLIFPIIKDMIGKATLNQQGWLVPIG